MAITAIKFENNRKFRDDASIFSQWIGLSINIHKDGIKKIPADANNIYLPYITEEKNSFAKTNLKMPYLIGDKI